MQKQVWQYSYLLLIQSSKKFAEYKTMSLFPLNFSICFRKYRFSHNNCFTYVNISSFINVCGKLSNGCKDVHILLTGVYKYETLFDKRDFDMR